MTLLSSLYLNFDPRGPSSSLGVRGQIWIAYSVLSDGKVKPYRFGLATISGFRDHSNVPWLRTDRNQLINIYLISFLELFYRIFFRVPFLGYVQFLAISLNEIHFRSCYDFSMSHKPWSLLGSEICCCFHSIHVFKILSSLILNIFIIFTHLTFFCV